MGKMFNDEWMRERGFLDDELKVKDVVAKKTDKVLHAVKTTDTVRSVLSIMRKADISQMPVMVGENIVGSISENAVLNYLLQNPVDNTEKLVEAIMDSPFPMVEADMPFSQLSRYISKKIPAVLCKDKAGITHIVTQYDMIQAV